MIPVKVPRGTIVVLEPDPAINLPVGHEQWGQRPAVVVSDESQRTRFPIFCVVPLTGILPGSISTDRFKSQLCELAQFVFHFTQDWRGKTAELPLKPAIIYCATLINHDFAGLLVTGEPCGYWNP